MTLQQWLGTDNKLGEDIFNNKYRFNNETFDQWSDRVSNGDVELKEAILDKKFLFAGRILSNRGLNKVGKKITYSNCYVVTPPEDNIESIFDTAKNLARTYSYGGGCGVDISKLRPEGSVVNNAAMATSGATSFMDLYDKTTEIIGQNGRRGALMISIDVSHPDIRKFINVKSDLNRVTKANISVKIDDAFMMAVESNSEYELHFEVKTTGEVIKETINAKELFMELCAQNHDFAEPGILFWDRISNYHLLELDENFEFAGTNPCAEEPLPAGGSCLLGSIILPSFIEDGVFNISEFEKVVALGVRSLNDVLDEGLSLHPLQEQRDTVGDWRQIGLGVLGVGDMLIKLGLKYDTDEAIEFCDKIANIMTTTALRESALVAKELGAYEKFNLDDVVNSMFFKNHASEDVIKLVNEYGLRNSQILTIAPTGSLGTMFGISTGIEPNFAFSYKRKTESLHGEDVYYDVSTKIAEGQDLNNLPSYFVSAQNIDPIKRVKMQGVWQNHIDASISSTVNVPNETTIQDVYNIYMEAWKQGLKGCTIYRDGCARQGILTLDGDSSSDKKILERGVMSSVPEDTIYIPRKIVHGCGGLKIMIGYSKSESKVVDVYIIPKMGSGCSKNITGEAVLISQILRLGGNLEDIKSAINGIDTCISCAVSKVGGKKVSGRNCPNILIDTILNVEKEYVKEDKSLVESASIEIGGCSTGT